MLAEIWDTQVVACFFLTADPSRAWNILLFLRAPDNQKEIRGTLILCFLEIHVT